MARREPMGTGRGPSQRQLRVGEMIRHAVSEILLRGEVHEPVLSGMTITVPEVRMTPDLKIATVYFMPLGGRDKDKALKALAREAKAMRRELARRVTLKYLPELRFRVDESFEEATRMDALLASDPVRRDLTAGDGPGEDSHAHDTETDPS